MLPNLTITYTLDIPPNGAGTYLIENNMSPKTILGLSFLQANVSSNTKVLCGTNVVYDNFAKDTPYIEMNFSCYDVLKISKTGNDQAMVVVNYTPYDNKTATPAIVVENSTSTPLAVYDVGTPDASTTPNLIITESNNIIIIFLIIFLIFGIFNFARKFFARDFK